MTQNQLINLLSTVELHHSQWEAILRIRILNYHNLALDLLPYLKHHSWIVRWHTLDKLIQLKDERTLIHIIDKLYDSNMHVQRKIEEAIMVFQEKSIKYLVSQFENHDIYIRLATFNLLLKMGSKYIPSLDLQLISSDWIIANRIVDLYWRWAKEGCKHSERALINSLSHPFVKRNSIIYLGCLNSENGLKMTLSCYHDASLRRIILLAISKWPQNEVYSLLIKISLSKRNYSHYILDIFKKIGIKVIPFLLSEFDNMNYQKNLQIYINILIKYFGISKTHLINICRGNNLNPDTILLYFRPKI